MTYLSLQNFGKVCISWLRHCLGLDKTAALIQFWINCCTKVAPNLFIPNLQAWDAVSEISHLVGVCPKIKVAFVWQMFYIVYNSAADYPPGAFFWYGFTIKYANYYECSRHTHCILNGGRFLPSRFNAISIVEKWIEQGRINWRHGSVVCLTDMNPYPNRIFRTAHIEPFFPPISPWTYKQKRYGDI